MNSPVKVDHHVYRGPRPEDLGVLRRDYDIDTIINLESGLYGLAHRDKYFLQWPADFGMVCYDMHCSDWFPPKREVVDKCIRLMSDRDRRTYIHCLSGVDRTGFICAVYRMRVQKIHFDIAVAEWIRLGRHPWFFWWKYELKKYAGKYASFI